MLDHALSSGGAISMHMLFNFNVVVFFAYRTSGGGTLLCLMKEISMLPLLVALTLDTRNCVHPTLTNAAPLDGCMLGAQTASIRCMEWLSGCLAACLSDLVASLGDRVGRSRRKQSCWR